MEKNLNIAYLNGAERMIRRGGNGSSNVSLMKEVTYAELKELRDGGKLVPGQMYRMTDYETTTSQEGTRSAGHPFDLILTALNEKTLDEKCSAIHSARDTEEYFANSNLAAWQVWYSLDNDGSRFDWAVYPMKQITVDISGIGAGGEPAIGKLNGTFEYRGITYTRWDSSIWGTECYFLTSSESVNISDVVSLFVIEAGYIVGEGSIISLQSTTSKGKGVIFRLIDEGRNDLPYDFKNIMFTRKITDSMIDAEGGTDTFVYTFNYYRKSVCKDYINMYPSMCRGNYMAYSKSLPNNVFFLTSFTKCINNTFGYKCCDNTFGSECHNNTFEYDCYNNTFGYGCYNNTFGEFCHNNTFGDDCYGNVFGNNCSDNTFEYNCHSNVFSYTCYGNTFMTECYCNIFGELCYSNSFGHVCHNNNFKGSCNNNIFGNSCNRNTFGHECNNNTFEASYSQNIELKYNVNNIKLSASGSGSSEAYVKNYEIKNVKGTSDSPIEITLTRNNTFTTYISKSSNGDIIQYTDEEIYDAIQATKTEPTES